MTPDGYAVNTLLAAGGPYPANFPKTLLLPPQTDATIGDRLDEKGIDWAWYSGGWDDGGRGQAGAAVPVPPSTLRLFREIRAVGTAGAKAHLKDEKDFIDGIEKGKLPPVVFFKPSGEDNEHPGYSSVLAGEYHTALLIQLIQRSPLWKDTRSSSPMTRTAACGTMSRRPSIDRWGPGTRVPALLISPFAKRGFIDHTVMDTTAILKLIETRYGLKPLGTRDAASVDMTDPASVDPARRAVASTGLRLRLRAGSPRSGDDGVSEIPDRRRHRLRPRLGRRLRGQGRPGHRGGARSDPRFALARRSGASFPTSAPRIEATLRELADVERCSLILTTGGTGPARAT